jgi:methylglutaconyl-CoA hydratase
MARHEKELVSVTVSERVATVTLNRPKVHNALNPALIEALSAVFHELEQRDDIRTIVLTGSGRSFCAGADLEFMKAAADYSLSENVADGQAIFDLMLTIDSCPKPVIGRINGAAIGGGVGLVSCCDIVVAVEGAKFGFSEVRLGLVPAVISPFVLAKIGVPRARELFLTGERFDAQYARSVGLVNHVVANEAELDALVQECVSLLAQGAPGAQSAAKQLIRDVAYQPKPTVRDYTAELIANLRAGREGREGMEAFLQKRQPNWSA